MLKVFSRNSVDSFCTRPLGSSVLGGVQADVFFTGEMGHHDVLAALAQGTSVILC